MIGVPRMDRDPHVIDSLCSIYPDWAAIVDDLAEAGRRRPIKKSSLATKVNRSPEDP
jgi:hypothetical protein